MLAGLLVTIAGLLLLSRAPVDGSYATDLLPAFILTGLGCGMCFVSVQIAAFAGVGEHEAGVGAGLINTSQETGGALGLAVIATIAYAGLDDELADARGASDLVRAAYAAADHDAFLAAAIFGGAALLLVALLMPRPRSVDEQTAPAAPGVAPSET